MRLREMTLEDVDAVLAIERQVHTHPWSRGNFTDALAAHYLCQVVVVDNELAGYAVLMAGVDDAELLNIGIASQRQRQDYAQALLTALKLAAIEMKKQRLVLEVRASNASAISLYNRVGFKQIGLRRGYYLTENKREDAILMGLIV